MDRGEPSGFALRKTIDYGCSSGIWYLYGLLEQNICIASHQMNGSWPKMLKGYQNGCCELYQVKFILDDRTHWYW